MSIQIRDVMTGSPVCLDPRTREHSVRRVPVVDDRGRPVGVVSLGDLAMERDRASLLGRISGAPANS